MSPVLHLQPCADISDTFAHLKRHYTVMYGQLHWALAFLYLLMAIIKTFSLHLAHFLFFLTHV